MPRKTPMIHINRMVSKEAAAKDTDLICYCFSYTKKDIEEDYVRHKGHSTIMDKIIAEKKAGQCDCGRKNPQGR